MVVGEDLITHLDPNDPCKIILISSRINVMNDTSNPDVSVYTNLYLALYRSRIEMREL